MNLSAHYASYRAAVSNDALESFADYSAEMKGPGQWRTMAGLLRDSVKNISTAVSEGNEEKYCACLRYHQQNVQRLFEAMVMDCMVADQYASLSKILTKGWNWFKFSPLVVHCTNQTWIPRFSPIFEKEWANGKPCFCADELALISKEEPSPQIINAMLEAKKKEPHIVTKMHHGGLSSFPLAKINAGEVREWTQELFP
jgi:hypothetical protein